jgi:hypothetical protein
MGTGDTAVGTLNGGYAIATIFTVETGGTGTFYYLALFTQNENGELVNTAVTSLGDRVIINGLAMSQNTIVVDMVQTGPDDALCCPTQLVQQLYELQGDELVQVSSTVMEP